MEEDLVGRIKKKIKKLHNAETRVKSHERVTMSAQKVTSLVFIGMSLNTSQS